MTTIDPTSDVATASGQGEPNAFLRLLAAEADWLTSSDHKIIGRFFVGGGLLGLLATLVVNVLISLDRADIAALDADAVAQIFDAQRLGLVFGTLMPLALGICIAIVPMQLGARALAFPRLAAAGFWMWLGGLVMAVVALANNGGGAGGDADMVDLYIGALALMAIGLAAAAASIITSVLTTRAPGMTMRRVPFFSMSALVMALGTLLIMPVAVGTLAYLFVDHRNGREAFGGNTGLYDWASWIFTQPATFLFTIPALGIVAEGATLLFRKRTPARGVVLAGFSLVGVAALAGVTQIAVFNVPADLSAGDTVKHLVPWALFNLLPILGATIVLLMALFLAVPVKGVKPNVTPAMLFGFLGAGMVLVGMLGNALNAIDDLDLQGTVFEEGALMYVVYGTVLATIGGLAHWAPKLWGKQLSAAKVMPLAAVGLLATVLAALPSFVEGFDEPREIYAILVLVGHALMALTVLAFVGLLMTTKVGADDNPYDGQTLEWATTSPAPTNNFADPPTVMSAEPLIDTNPTDFGSDA